LVTHFRLHYLMNSKKIPPRTGVTLTGVDFSLLSVISQ
jgi:hypothetical protein